MRAQLNVIDTDSSTLKIVQHVTIAYASALVHGFSPSLVTLQTYPTATVASILSCTLGGKECLQPSALQPHQQTAPYVIKHNVYHADGLWPADKSNPLFVAKCVFKTTKFVLRHLSIEEKLFVHDIPASLHPVLGKAYATNVVESMKTAIKCFSALVNALFLQHTWSIGGESVHQRYLM